MVVQHNMQAANANRMLGITVGNISKSTEKLSSGYRINRAADDAAGLSISEKMRKQIRGLSQASTNAQDGISAVQTTEGALTEVHSMLQRMNELAVQSANGTNSESDRDAIQAEIDQLVTEIDRVSETTKFNETYLLKGDTSAEKDTKFAYKETDVLTQDLYYLKDGAIQTAKKGTYIASLDSNISYFASKDGSEIGETILSSEESTYFGSAQVSAIDEDGLYKKVGSEYKLVSKGEEYSGTAGDYYKLTAGATGELDTMTQQTSAPTTAPKWELQQDVYDKAGNVVKSGTLVDNKNDYFKSKGAAFFDNADKVDLADYTETAIAQFTDKEGNEIAANGLDNYINNDGTLKTDAKLYLNGKEATQEDIDNMVSTDKILTGALTLKLHVGADATDNNQISIKIDAMSSDRLGIEGIKVDGEDDTNAKNAIETIKEAISKVSSQRSDLGAVQNRLEHTISNLDNVVENTTSAESRIRDVDMAEEMVTYSKNSILQQAGQSMLAQANQANQGVLSLLG